MIKRTLRLITLLACLCPTLAHTQVTIGSEKAPREGILLDLKEDNDTSTKGMMLPRVVLSDVTKLKMGENEIVDGTTNEYAKHIGLVIYNIVETTPAVCADIPEGIYIWDGEKWNPLRSPISSFEGRGEVIDNRPQVHGTQIYLTRRFGGAGEWMLENVRYIPVDATGAATIPVLKLEDLTGFDKAAQDRYKSIFYPQSTFRGTETDPTKTTPVWQPKYGVLYSFAAATDGAKDDIQADQGVLPETTTIQGVCPFGWHIPSDYEWTQLEKEIYTRPEKYSTLTNEGPWDDLWKSFRGMRAGNLGGMLKSSCRMPGTRLPGEVNASSFTKENGGFEVLLVGSCGTTAYALGYAQESSFWSSSIADDNNDHQLVWARQVSLMNRGVLRDAAYKHGGLPVRCKKD